MRNLKFTFLLALVSLAGCASVNSISITPIPAKRDNRVSAEVSRFIFLGFNFDNNYIDPLVDNLKSQCPGGVVSGILTKDETMFYLLAHTRKVTATGFCNRANSAQNKPLRKSASDNSAENLGLE